MPEGSYHVSMSKTDLLNFQVPTLMAATVFREDILCDITKGSFCKLFVLTETFQKLINPKYKRLHLI